MANGKPGDHPFTDMLLRGAHPFPADIEEMVRRLDAIDPHLLHDLDLDAFAWERGEGLDEGRTKLKELLARQGA